MMFLRLFVISVLVFTISHVSGLYMSQSDYTIERLNVPATRTGESPYWDVKKQILYYVDIPNMKICCYKYTEDESFCAVNEDSTLADSIGFIVPVAGKRNNYVIGVGTRIVEIVWIPPSATFKIVKLLADVGDTVINRMNDGKADPKGRVFFGTMNRLFAGRTGAFYRLSKKNDLVQLFDGVGVSNGLVWSNDAKTMYYIDSRNQSVTGYDYNLRTGDMTNQRTIINTAEYGYTIPDGMTNDVNERLYVASYDRGVVLVINPDSAVIEHTIVIPDTTNVTSVAFGGPCMNELFVTSGYSIPSMSGTGGGLYKITFAASHIRGTELFKAKLSKRRSGNL